MWVVVALFLLPAVLSIEVEKTVRSRLAVETFESFEFREGGSIFIHVKSVSNDNVALFVCSNNHWKSFMRYQDCEPNRTTHCLVNGVKLEKGQDISLRVPATDSYHFMLQDCEYNYNAAGSTKLQYQLLNPHHSQLPYGSEPLPILYIVLTSCWLAVLGVWFILGAYVWGKRGTVRVWRNVRSGLRGIFACCCRVSPSYLSPLDSNTSYREEEEDVQEIEMEELSRSSHSFDIESPPEIELVEVEHDNEELQSRVDDDATTHLVPDQRPAVHHRSTENPLDRRSSGSVHLLLSLIVIVKLLVTSMDMIYWLLMKYNGTKVAFWAHLYGFQYAVVEAIFFLVVIMIISGWKISRNRLPEGEVRTNLLAVILLLSSLLFFSFYSEGYYFLSYMTLYFFMLPKAYRAGMDHLRLLKVQRRLMQHISDSDLVGQRTARRERDKIITVLAAKIGTQTLLVVAVLVLLVISPVVSLLHAGLPFYTDWINHVLTESVILIAMVVILFLLAPNSRRGIFSYVGLLSALDVMSARQLDEMLRSTESSDAEEQEQQRLDVDKDVIIVQYPTGSDSSKLVQKSLALGFREYDLYQ